MRGDVKEHFEVAVPGSDLLLRPAEVDDIDSKLWLLCLRLFEEGEYVNQQPRRNSREGNLWPVGNIYIRSKLFSPNPLEPLVSIIFATIANACTWVLKFVAAARTAAFASWLP